MKLINDQQVEFDWGELGLITLDRKTGLLMAQEIAMAEGKRTVELIEWKKNPGAKAISSRMQLPFKDAPRRDLVETGMSKQLLRWVFQELVTESGKNKNLEIKPYLAEIEDGFVTFLQKEKLEAIPFGDRSVRHEICSEGNVTKVSLVRLCRF
jgi:hypothetical protein